MRTLYEHSIGSDGAIAGLYVDGDRLIAQESYPLQKALDQPEAVIDRQIDGLEVRFPIAKGLLETVRSGYKAAITKFIGGA